MPVRADNVWAEPPAFHDRGLAKAFLDGLDLFAARRRGRAGGGTGASSLSELVESVEVDLVRPAGRLVALEQFLVRILGFLPACVAFAVTTSLCSAKA